MVNAVLPAVPVDRRGPGEAPGRLWRRWVVAAFLGETLGFGVPVLAAVLGADALPTGPRLLAFAVAGAGEGAVLGLAQSRVLGGALPGFPAGAWTGRTALGAALAWVLGMTPSALGDAAQHWPVPLRIGLALPGGLILLLSIGTAQWTVLRRWVPGAARWIGWTALAWLGGLTVFMVVALPLWQPDQPTWLIALIGVVAGSLMALTMAAVTGWGLIRVLGSRPAPAGPVAAQPGAGAEPETAPSGLTAAEVAERAEHGLSNASTVRTSRTLGEIVRANVVTFFNGLLAALCVVAIAAGPWQNALFGGVVVANAGIGIVQEVRAKRTLDRLAVLTAPRARVVRDGAETEVAVADVVLGDLLELRAGDQVPADGVVRTSGALAVDESLLTGEAEPVAKAAGDPALSGSIVVAGAGTVQATAVGDSAYAARLAGEARRFTTTYSELVAGTTRLLRWIAVVLVVVGPLVLWSQFRSTENPTWREALTGTVAALVGMVPEGLVLLTTLAFLVAALTLARHRTLVQELPAVEALARVDVVCLDKTGTLTHGDVRFDEWVLLDAGREQEARAAVGTLVAADPANATAGALGAAFPAPAARPAGIVPFSSARKWSAVRLADGATWVLGAPEMVLPAQAQDAARTRADALAAEGRRVLLLARSPEPLPAGDGEARLPAGLVPVALVVLAERIREDAAATLAYFTAQGVALKVLSGDNPRTVGAVAAAVGVPGVHGAADAVDARTLPEDDDALAAVLESASVFGRVTPYQKRAAVRALQRAGHVVAMTGDGVNDALALKDADIGVAMGTGAPATRAVAQLVLLDGRFAHLPDAVAEGRRVIANIERAANLFLTKNVYSLVLALITVATAVAYPLAPVQLTLISAVTIGVPGFFLALGPNRRRYRPGFLTRVLRFALPAGLVTGVAAFTAYALARWLDPAGGVAGARTASTLVVLVVALWTLSILARPLTGWKLALICAMVGVVVLVLAVPALSRGLVLLELSPQVVLLAAAIGAPAAALVELATRLGARIGKRTA